MRNVGEMKRRGAARVRACTIAAAIESAGGVKKKKNDSQVQ